MKELTKETAKKISCCASDYEVACKLLDILDKNDFIEMLEIKPSISQEHINENCDHFQIKTHAKKDQESQTFEEFDQVLNVSSSAIREILLSFAKKYKSTKESELNELINNK